MALRDGRDVPSGGETVDHYGIVANGYVALPQIPKVSDAAANTWVDTTTAATNMFILSAWNGTAWVPLTISATLPVTTSQYYVDAERYQYSNRIYVHADYNGNQLHVNYKALGSLIEAETFNALDNRITSSTPGRHIYPYSESTYSNGAFDASVADGTKVYLTGSQYALVIPGYKAVSYAGGFLDFGTAGNMEVAAYSTADYWKRITISIRNSGSTLVVTKTESAEQALQSNLAEPVIDSQGHTAFYVDIQNNGTISVAGAINAILQENITYLNVPRPTPIRTPLLLKYSGLLVANLLFDSVITPGMAGEIESFIFSCSDIPGYSGSTILNIYAHTPGSAGTTMLATPANKPTIAASGGTYQVDVTPATDFSTTAFGATTSFRVMIDQVAADAADFSAIMWVKLYDA